MKRQSRHMPTSPRSLRSRITPSAPRRQGRQGKIRKFLPWRSWRLGALGAFGVILSFAAGCATSTSGFHWLGPASPVEFHSDPWIFHGRAAVVIETQHYAIHTTITDTDLQRSIAQLMEGAYCQYQMLCHGVAPSGRAMNCYIFAQRPSGRSTPPPTRGRMRPSICRSTGAVTRGSIGSSPTTSARPARLLSRHMKVGISLRPGISRHACRRFWKRASPRCSRHSLDR